MQLKHKKDDDGKSRVVKVERKAEDWQRLIQEAKRKEMNWKTAREESAGETERQEE